MTVPSPVHDFDRAMNRIAIMNSSMHGFKNPNIAYRDSLNELPAHEREYYDIVLANPPFAGSLDAERVDPAIRKIANTKKTELLFLARFLTLLKVGGRAAVIVPEGVLFGSTKAHKALRQELVENQKLDAVIKLPSGVFKPYSGVSTAVLCFTKTDSGGTDEVWFYDMLADGRSLDDKRTALLPDNLLGPAPHETVTEETPLQDPTPVKLTTEQLEKNNLPDLVARFRKRNSSERERKHTEQSFTVSIEDIRDTGYELSMNRYKEIVFEDEETRDPQDILDDIIAVDSEITEALAKVRNLLGGTR